MRVPTVSARFATAPVFWNWAMVAVARLAPKGFLEDRAKWGTLPCVLSSMVCMLQRARRHWAESHAGGAALVIVMLSS